jgi:Co/Zn/Cd efflux system component
MPLNSHRHENQMSKHCTHHHNSAPAHTSARYRRVLWIALCLNALMFVVELYGGFIARSVSLLADSIDFFGDAANYALSLAVLGMTAHWRARAALLKAFCMLAFGVFVIGKALWSLRSGAPPEALTMGAVAALALAVNVSVTAMLYAWREGDANMRSVWLCSRNDALSNIAVMLAALGVFGTQRSWPDLLVASIMGALAISSGLQVIAQARKELGASPH